MIQRFGPLPIPIGSHTASFGIGDFEVAPIVHSDSAKLRHKTQ